MLIKVLKCFSFVVVVVKEETSGSTKSSEYSLRVKTAPVKRKSWQLSDFDLKTDDGQLHIEASGKNGEKQTNITFCLIMVFFFNSILYRNI